jgi:hypothetical protein
MRSLSGFMAVAFAGAITLAGCGGVVLIGTSGVGATGAYTIDVSASTTLAGAAAEGPIWRGPVRLPVAPLRLPKGWLLH